MTANIKVVGVGNVKSQLGKIHKRLNDRKVAHQKSVIIIDRWIQKNFSQEGKLLGKKWVPLADSTIKARKRNKGRAGTRILQDTGRLKTQWKHFWNSKYGLVRSNVPYAYYHDSEEPRKHLPRRQVLPDKKHIYKELVKVFDGFVRTSLR